MSSPTLRRVVSASGLELPGRSLEQIEQYWALVSGWRRAVNLTACRDEVEFVETLVLGALAPVHLGMSIPGPGPVLDVGSGAGIPGIPLAVAWPDRRMTLLDSQQRKVSFLRHAARELSLSNVTVALGRAEALGHDPEWREGYGLVVSRAFAPVALACEACLPFVAVGGEAWLYVSRESGEAGLAAAPLLEPLGVTAVSLREARYPSGSAWLLVLKKTQSTHADYPRRFHHARRHPLFA